MSGETESWPSCPFWDFSIALYEASDVTPVCLALQDKHGVDVNLLLFALWAGAAQDEVVDRKLFEKISQETGEWRCNVVSRLRDIRRTVKPMQDSEQVSIKLNLYNEIKELELKFEHLSQIRIWQLFMDHHANASNGLPSSNRLQAICQRNIETLFEVENYGVLPGRQEAITMLIDRALGISNN